MLSAEVHGLQAAPTDPSLFPSDHAAVKATLRVSRSRCRDSRPPTRPRQQGAPPAGHKATVAAAAGAAPLAG